MNMAAFKTIEQSNASVTSDPARVSVIVPVYNVDRYLEQCLKSVIAQDYTALELIVIDDGSTDDSLGVARKAIECLPFAKIISTSNAGQSIARNMGLDLATGKYVLFLDGDDYLSTDAISTLVQKLQGSRADAVFFSALTFLDGLQNAPAGDFNYRRPQKIVGRLVPGPEFFRESIREGAYTVSPCLYLFRKDSLAGLRFFPGIIHEDNLFTTSYLMKGGLRVTCIQDKLYYRRLRPGSVMSELKQEKHLHGYLTVAEQLSAYQDKGLVCERELGGFIQSMLAAAIGTCAAIPRYGFPRPVRRRILVVLGGIKVRHLKLPHVILCLVPQLILLKNKFREFRYGRGA